MQLAEGESNPLGTVPRLFRSAVEEFSLGLFFFKWSGPVILDTVI